MNLKFLGAAQEVGRSAILLEDSKRLLLDYGVKINANKPEYPADVHSADAVILSHAHLDHSGYVPALYNHMAIPTFGTYPTLKLSELLLEDSLNVAKKNKNWPGFKTRDIRTFMSRYVNLNYRAPITIDDFNVTFYDAGHISGSAITLIEREKAKDNRRVVYTGDFKVEKQELHDGAEIIKSDVLITEATYATREHPDREKTIREFIEKIKETLDNGGNALIPVFAVGRSQEILSILHRHNLCGMTYLDGMARAATSIVANYPRFINNSDTLESAIGETTRINDRSDRHLALGEPSIIVTTSGMLNGGPVLDYITRLNRQSSILITGYQVEGSNGRTLIDNGTMIIDEVKRRISTPVTTYDLSAHAGMSDIYRYVRESDPNLVLCVHADNQNATTLAENLSLEGFNAVAPKLGDVIKVS